MEVENLQRHGLGGRTDVESALQAMCVLYPRAELWWCGGRYHEAGLARGRIRITRDQS